MKNESEQLLLRWEDNYKKGLLTFWLLLLLHERPAYPFETSALVAEISQGSISVDDNSVYRALNRFEEMGIVNSQIQANNAGPDRRYYSLTGKGVMLLRRFIERNILIFQSAETARKIQAVLATDQQLFNSPTPTTEKVTS